MEEHTVEGLLADIAKYRERLEVDRAYQCGPGTPEGHLDTVFFEYRGFDNEDFPDGISCRDETIKLMDERLGEQSDEITRLRLALANEREECAKVAETMGGDFIECDLHGDGYREARKHIATAIRSRKDKGE